MSTDLRSLVLRAQAGDSDAMNDAIAATMSEMRQYAERFARRSGVDAADLESAMAMATKRCVEQYDGSRSSDGTSGTRPFENYVRSAWAQEAKKCLVTMLGRKERLPIDPSGEEAMRNETERKDVAVEAVVSQTVKAMIARLEAVDTTLATVAQLLADGVPYDQIAKACGVEGSDNLRKMWTRRQIDEIRRRLADEGDTIRIDAPKTKYHGEKAIVVGHASPRTGFSHVVEFSDGRRRAVKACEVDLSDVGEEA